jgi:hypothetical protein
MPYCPACRADYAPGTPRCHDCDVDLEEAGADDSAEPAALPPEPLVTIATFDTPLKADLFASRLEADGVECFIADAETIGLNGLLAGAVGGVKVQVRESQGRRAAAIFQSQTSRSAVPPCPRCGSTDVQRQGLPLLASLLIVFTLGILALFFPIFWSCRGCAHRWT